MLSLLFHEGTSPYARLIRWRTGHNISHVELLDDDRYEAYSADTWAGVVRREPPHYNINPRWTRVPIVIPDQGEALRFLRMELGSRYDWLGIWLSQAVALGREHPERWFCSELVMAALRAGGCGIGKDPHWFSPGDVRTWIYGAGSRFLQRPDGS